MAINRDDVSIRVSAVNETSKPLKEARADFERFEDSVKAAASALDDHKGHPRQFANAMKNAFTPLAGIAKDTVGKLSASLDALEHDLRSVEDAMSFKDANMDGLRKAKAAIDAESDAVQRKVAAEKQAAKQAADDAKARAAQIAADIKARQADVRQIEKQIAAEQRLHDRTEQRLIKNRKTLEEPKRLSAKRQQALEEASVDDANALVASRNRMEQLVRARAASAAIVEPLIQERQAHKDLTAVAKREAGERIAAIKAEENAIKKRDRALESSIKSATLERNTLAAKRDAIIQDRSHISDVRDNAVRLQSQLRDPTDVRRVAKSISDGPAREARGMAALSAETRRAADAQRLLNGETRTGAPLFASLRSELMALVGVYAIYSTAVSQASSVVDAFNTKEAFTVAVGSAGGNADDALSQWDYLIQTANKYKFAISGISDEYSKLVINSRGAGLTEDDTRTIFEGVLAKARATNLTTEQIQNAFRALNQTVSKGQLYSEELKGQLAEAIPGAVTDMARALGYGADQMKQFSKDLEAGAFGAEAVVKYADYLMAQNSGAVEAAGNTFKAAVADLQNVLFETRLKLAEGGFMDGMKDTVQKLADFFKSEDGQAYMIRLADAANVVVKALAAAARNIDLIIAGLGAMAGLKIASAVGGALMSVAGAASTGVAGMSAMAGSAGALASALGLVRAAGGLLLRMMGGIPGMAITGALALSQLLSSARAADAARINSAMDRTKSVIDEIRNAAVEANGDLDRFQKLLTDAGLTSGAKMAAAMADINTVMEAERRKFGNAMQDLWVQAARDLDLTPEVRSSLTDELLKLKRDMPTMTFGELEKRLNAVSKAYGLSTDAVSRAISHAAEFDNQNRNRITLLGVAQNRLDDVSKAFVKNGTAAADSAGDVGAYNEALEALKKLGDDASAAEDFAEAMRDIQKNADAAAKAVAGTRDEAKKLADIEKVVRGAQLTNAARFLEKRYGDAGLTLRPSAELVGIIEKLNSSILTIGADGQPGWVPETPPGGGSYIANTSGKMENRNGRLVAQDPALKGLTVSQAALLNAIAAPESGGAYNVRFGGAKGAQTFDLNGVHPNIRERNPANGTYSTAAGRYQFIGSTYRGIMGNAPFTPENQDRAALKNAEQAWQRNGVKGVSLYDYLDRNGMDQTVRNALKGQWEGFVGNAGFDKAKSAFDASRSRYMANGVTVGSVNAGSASIGADGSIVRAPAASAAPVTVQDPLTPEQKRALEIVSAAAPSLPEKAQTVLYDAVLKNLGAADDLGFINELKSGQLTRIGDAIEKVAGADQANAFRRETDILASAQQADANAEAFAAVKDVIEAARFTKDDLEDQSSRSAAVTREAAQAIEKLTKDGASLAKAMGTGTDAEARTKLTSQVDQRMQVEYGKQLAEDTKKRAEEQAKFNQASDKSVRNARQEAELAGIVDEREKARLRARQQIANEQEDSGFTYSAAQIAAREAAEMAKFEAEQNAETARSRREQGLADEKMTRDSQNRVALAGEQNEIERERLAIRQRLLDQERESGVARTDAQRNALVEQEMAAFMAERGNQIRENQLKSQLGELQAQLALMEQKAAEAVASGNFDERDRLRGQIVGIRTEIVNAIKALEEFYRKMGGPEGRQGLLEMEKLRLETQRGTAEFQRMTPEVKSIADVIEGNLNAAVSNFSQMVADGMDPWDALKQTVKQAVGQILIDIGQMIVRAVIARAVMSALGMSPSGQAGPLNSTAQSLGNMATMPGGQFHEGGIAGDPNRSIDFISGLMNLKSDETPAILQVGEEVLTRQDPRHRRNIKAGVSKFMRFHTGGISEIGPDAVSSTLAAAGSAGRSISVSMNKAVADAPAPIINNRNFFDMDSLMNDYMATPAGQRSVRNVITKDRNKLRALFS